MKRNQWIRRFIMCCLFFCMTAALFVVQEDIPAAEQIWGELRKTGGMELSYAQEFTVDYLEGGYSLITISGTERYLTIPEGMEAPEQVDDDITLLALPFNNLYLAASSAMDLFRELDALSCVKMTGTDAQDWSIPEIAEQVASGDILYSGKYSAPDYELLLTKECDLAVESTMIYHTPEVKEQLENIGIPVLVERSSYEVHPMGRVEWIRLYGLLTGTEDKADAYMAEASKRYAAIEEASKEDGPTVAFFYISSNGYVNVRKPGDYITRMIESAGGRYAFADLVPESENALSTINLQMEAFYETAVDADILIYNSTIDRELDSIDQLLQKSPLLADFKAVQTGNVWGTGKNMYQETTGVVGMVEDFYRIIAGTDSDTEEPLNYLHRLD